MKKIFLMFCFFIISFFTYAQNIQIDATYFLNELNKRDVLIYLLTDNNCIVVGGYRNGFELENKKLSVCTVWPIDLKLKGHFIVSTKPDIFCYNKSFLIGKGIIIPVAETVSNEMLDDLKSLSPNYFEWKKYKEIDQYRDISAEVGVGEADWWLVKIFDAGIKNISASSYLSENTKKGFVEYIPSNLTEKLYYRGGPDYDHILYDSVTPPWVEGAKGYGIDEYLDIEFKWKSDEIQILNGFVDFLRKNLYTDNSRVKTLLIESQKPKFAMEYELEDIVRYNVIKLPEKTDKIRMTIKDVYKGDKYDDTCISSILVTNPNIPTYEEMKEKILEAVKINNIKLE